MTEINLNTEAELDPSIQFSGAVKSAENPHNILLTGATGFLGAYLLDELLRVTDADIHCLVRGDDAAERLKRKLQFFGIWREELAQRIIPVVGDLGEPCLGLSARQFAQLAERIDVIYHNGAHVNAMYPYARLKEANVLGTERVLRLAATTRTKPVHFISTLGVFFSDSYQDATITERDPVIADETMRGGYKQSKWVAEQLVHSAHQRGLPVTIHRPGRIWGHSETGIMTQFGDLLGTIVQACVQLEVYPAAETTLNLCPVDFASRAIVQLSQQPTSNGQIFHICNPHPTEWQTFWHAIRDLGYPLAETSYTEWVAAIKARSRTDRETKLWSILRHLLRAPIYMFEQKPHFDASHTMAALDGIRCPKIDRAFLQRYLDQFVASDFI